MCGCYDSPGFPFYQDQGNPRSHLRKVWGLLQGHTLAFLDCTNYAPSNLNTLPDPSVQGGVQAMQQARQEFSQFY